MARRGGVTALVCAALLCTLSGCGGGGEPTSSVTTTTAADDSAPRRGAEIEAPEASAAETVTPSRCPANLPACRTTEGRIVYVERVDPDGDGDAHFVIADPQGITLRGLTFVDVRKGLRPSPLPGPGELISAAGPVQTGSYGQSQIHAVELHVAGE